MDTLSLQRTLTSMWPLVFSAKERALEPSELAELRRLAELVKRGSVSRPAFNHRAGALYETVSARLLTERGSAAADLEEILEEIDELRGILQS